MVDNITGQLDAAGIPTEARPPGEPASQAAAVADRSRSCAGFSCAGDPSPSPWDPRFAGRIRGRPGSATDAASKNSRTAPAGPPSWPTRAPRRRGRKFSPTSPASAGARPVVLLLGRSPETGEARRDFPSSASSPSPSNSGDRRPSRRNRASRNHPPAVEVAADPSSR